MKAIAVINRKTFEVSYNDEIHKSIGLKTKSGKAVKTPFYASKCDENGNINLLFKNCEHYVRYNLSTQKVEYIVANPILAESIRSCADGGAIWLITEKSDTLVNWNPELNSIKEYPIPKNASDAIANIENVFSGIINCGDYLLLFPMLGNAILKFDKENAVFSEFNDLPVPDDSENKIMKYSQQRVGDKLFAFARFSKIIYEMDLPTGEIVRHRFKLDDAGSERYMRDYLQQFVSEDCADNRTAEIPERVLGDSLWFFTAKHGFEEAIREKQRNSARDLTANTAGTSGKSIYEYVKAEVN